MPSRDAAESRSTAATFGNAKKHDAIVKKLWGVAKSCPTFSKKVTVNGRTTTRTDRLIGSHSYKIALAGAVRAHTTRTRRELFRLGMTPQEEAPSQPFKMTMSPGARLCFEQFMCALAQQGCLNAKAVLEEVHMHSRMHRDAVRIGYRQMAASVFEGSGPHAVGVTVLPTPNKRNSKKKEVAVDEEFVPPKAECEDEGEGEGEDKENE